MTISLDLTQQYVEMDVTMLYSTVLQGGAVCIGPFYLLSFSNQPHIYSGRWESSSAFDVVANRDLDKPLMATKKRLQECRN